MNADKNLEHRFRRLLRWYPDAYRAEHGEEIVATYLDAAPRGRTKPSLADTGDIVAAGLRQRLRHRPDGLPGGTRLAAAVALSVMTAVAFVFTALVEARPPLHGTEFELFGAFQSPAVIVWALWMVVGLAASVLPGRAIRPMAAVALAAMLASLPVAYQTNFASPPMYVMVPLAVFGAMVLAWPKNPHWTMRIALPLGLLAGLGTFGVIDPNRTYRTSDAVVILPNLVLLLLGAMLIAGAVEFLVRRTGRSLWAVSVLLLPAVWFAAYTLAGSRMYASGWTMPDGRIVLTAMWCGLAAVVVPLVAVTWGHLRAARR